MNSSTQYPMKPVERPLRIAFTPSGGSTWTGGLTYQKNLVTALQQYAPHLTIYKLCEEDNQFVGHTANHIRMKNLSDANPFLRLAYKASMRLFNNDSLLDKTLRSIPGGKVDLAFPCRHRLSQGIASVYWIPDFQYLHMPEMYNPAAIASLDKKYRQGIHNADLVILSSQHACQDFHKFAVAYRHKARVVRFVAHTPANLYDHSPDIILQKYHLPEKFIYLPNQFWKHKNHETVFESLRILKDSGITPYLVLTGNPIDSRNPLYFASLVQKISEWGLRDQVAMLGLIPHEDVYHLIRQSVCVLNPSFFEGWSTTVEEARSVGKRLVLSDIPVHREQDPPTSLYFDPHNPEQLAQILVDLYHTLSPGPDLDLEELARRQLPERMKVFAHTFVDVACEAVSIARKY